MSEIPESLKISLQSEIFAEMAEEVAQVASENPPGFEQVLIEVDPKYMFHAIMGAVLYDAAPLVMRTNGLSVSPEAAENLTACNIPFRVVQEAPGRSFGRSMLTADVVWQSEQVQNDNTEDSISGEKIILVRKKPRRNQIRSESIQLG